MGSLDKYCRLCALCVRQDHLLKLWEDSGGGEKDKCETPNCAKLRSFLGFGLSSEDRLPKQVCVQCVNNLDYCVQFVDKCRRIESLLQRGLDVDYVASELDYRYTYLFPSPYAGQEARPAYPDFPATDTAGSYFGATPNSQEAQEGQEQEGLNLVREEEGAGQFQEARGPGGFQEQEQEAGYLPPLQPPLVQSPEVKEVVAGQQAVPMYRPDVSVDNMVVEIEPQDLFPRKPGGVKVEYPWRVGGAPRIRKTAREGGEAAGCRKVRSILPKALPPPPLMKPVLPPPTTAGPGQVMIPVTLKTPCKKCNKLIIASSLSDLKNHVCSRPEEKTEACPVAGCGKRFSSKNALKYHAKHCRHTAASPKVHKKEVDIMSIATSELVGAGDRGKVVVGGLELLGGGQDNFTSQLGGFLGVAGKAGGNKRTFVCPYKGCAKSYTAKNYLVQHERIHTGERPYSCTNCGKDFSRVLDMKKHQLLKVCY